MLATLGPMLSRGEWRVARRELTFLSATTRERNCRGDIAIRGDDVGTGGG